MPSKKGGSLVFPSDPLAAMRELGNLDSVREDVEANQRLSPEEYKEKNTEKNTEFNAQRNTENITEVDTGLNTETLAPLHAEVNTGTSPPRRVRKRKETMPEKKAESYTSKQTTDHPPIHGPGYTSVRQRIIEDMTKEPVVRKTIDIPASLNDRLQDYCAAKRIKTERRVFLVLLENFLEEEGF